MRLRSRLALGGFAVVVAGALAPGVDCRRSIGAALGVNALTIDPVDSDFGRSVAAGADTVAVGMPGPWPSSVAGRAPGAVYVYTSTDEGWTFHQKLVAPRDTVVNQFGRELAISGDMMLVGAPLQPQPNGGHGALHVFTRRGDTWTQTAELTIPGSRQQQGLGYASAVSGDVIAAAAPQAVNDGVAGGRVYVFRKTGGDWKREATLFRPEARSGNMFGKSIALSGEVLAVGSSPSSDLGVHLYLHRGEQWEWDRQIETGAGATVAMGGDLLAVAPTRYGHSPQDPVEVWLYRRSAEQWMEEARLKIDEAPPRDYIELGLSVAEGRVAVHHSDRGQVQLYERVEGRWTRMATHDVARSLNRSLALAGKVLVAGASQPLSHSMGKRTNDASAAVGVPIIETRSDGLKTVATVNPPDVGAVIWPF